MKRLTAVLLALLLLLPLLPAAALSWPEGAAGALRQYVETVNGFLAAQGEPEINSVFECYSSFAVIGVTDAEMSDTPEQNEIAVYLSRGELHYLQLRVTDQPARFSQLAAALIIAASPGGMTLKDAQKEANRCVEKAAKAPANSFSDTANTIQGDSLRAYFAYEPAEYPGQNPAVRTLQMTLVFPLPGYGSPVYLTPAPEEENGNFNGEGSPEWEGGTPLENLYGASEEEYESGIHFNVEISPTPEPQIEWNATPTPSPR